MTESESGQSFNRTTFGGDRGEVDNGHAATELGQFAAFLQFVDGCGHFIPLRWGWRRSSFHAPAIRSIGSGRVCCSAQKPFVLTCVRAAELEPPYARWEIGF